MSFLQLVALAFLGTILFMTEANGMALSNATDSNGTETCLAINARNVLEDEVPTTIPASVLLLGCVEADNMTSVNTTFVFNAGKINVDTLSLECEDAPLFSIIEDEEEGFPTFPIGDMPSICVNDTCVVYGAVNQTVFLSALVLEEELGDIRAMDVEIPFLLTDVLYDFEGLLEQFASSLLSAFLSNINDEFLLRAMAFLGSAETNCSLV